MRPALATGRRQLQERALRRFLLDSRRVQCVRVVQGTQRTRLQKTAILLLSQCQHGRFLLSVEEAGG